MFDEIMKSIKSTLYDRTVSPLSGTFIVSWCIWNWPFVYAIVLGWSYTGSERIEERLQIAASKLSWEYGFWYPLASSAILICAIPLVAHYAYYVALWNQRRLNTLRWEFEQEEPLSRKDAAELRLKIRELETNFSKAIEEKEKELQSREDDLIALQKSKPLNNNDSNQTSLVRNENPIVKALKAQGIDKTFVDLAARILIHEALYGQVNSIKGFEKFVSLGLIQKHRPANQPNSFAILTEKGMTIYNELQELT